jgi:hypothetical protein
MMDRRTALAVFGTGVLTNMGWTISAVAAADGKRISDAEVAAWVNQRVQAWQPTAAERRFDEIAWVKDIRTAERLAGQHQRPVFLFTHDGHMAIGRC